MIRSSISNKKTQAILGAVAALVSVLFLWAGESHASDAHFPFYIYREFHSKDNHFIPSGWMGDYKDIRFDDHWRPEGAKDAKTVVHITYSAEGLQDHGWAGIYWQYPANDWGDKPGGLNLNGAKKLVFKARGEKGGEIISELKVGGISGDYADSGSASIGPITLAKDWKEYAINLDGQELSSITGGFCWVMSREDNPSGASFYLDDIRFE
jgi:hypothetical protein